MTKRTGALAHMWSGVAHLTLMLLATARALPAQAAPARAEWVRESWTIADGLPVNSVYRLLQSKTGYIWGATFDGLLRFDGVRFTVFNTENSPGLPSNRIMSIVESRDSTIWLTSEQGSLVAFAHGRFTHIDRGRGIDGAVLTVAEDRNGTVWVGTERSAGMIRNGRYTPVAAGAIRGPVLSLAPANDGGMWVGTQGRGLFLATASGARRVSAATPLDTLPIGALLEDPQARLWAQGGNILWKRARDTLMMITKGLGRRSTQRFLYEPGTGSVISYSPAGIARVSGDRHVPLLTAPHEYVRAAPMQVRGADSIWTAIRRNLWLNGRLEYTLDTLPGAQAGRITDLLFDNEGGIWLSTEGLGLHRLRRGVFSAYGAADGLAARNAYSVTRDSGDNIWVASTLFGLSRIDAATGSIRNIGRFGRHVPYIGSLLFTGSDTLLVGESFGIYACERTSLRCTTEASFAVDPQLSWPGVYALFQRRSGSVVAGTGRTVLERRRDGWHPLPGWTSRSPARAFAESADGALWVGTNGAGIVRCVAAACRTITTADGLPSDVVRSLHADADGWLWIGTEGHGLARLDSRRWPANDSAIRSRITRITVRDGLYDPVVHQILDDGQGRLWMSSNRGIYWVTRADLMNFADGKIARIHSTAYTERDGLRNREANGGYQPAGVRDGTGRLWFATQEGAVSVDPALVPRIQTAPGVVIEQVSTPLRGRSADTVALILDATERDLEIAYAAPTYREPRNVRFRYRLEPYDTAWVDAGVRRTAFYTRVPPGRYTFRVAANQSGDTWSERPAAIGLTITPQFHQTSLAKTLLALALALSGLAVVQWRLRQVRQRERELTALVETRTAALKRNEVQLAAQNEKLAQLNQLRSRLFANLSHEFRTPLTLILGPLGSLLDGRHGTLGPTIREQAELMQRNGQRLLRLINQILDLARLQAGAVAITRQPLDLVAFTRTVAQAFSPLADRQGIAVVFRSALRTLTVDADGEQIEKVVLNLLSNAVKFTGAGGIVDVSVATDADDALITVRDTGVGISAADLPRIFERFYQVDSENTRKYDGTGIGLALVKELVELHGGEITVRSALNEGTTFVVRLPIGAVAAQAVTHTALAPETIDDILGLDATLPAGELPQEESADDRVTVLVVDDNADVRAYVRSILAPSFHVLEAADGHAGLLLAREALPDLIVADVMMPELDGLGLAAALKSDAMTDAIPVVLLTARAAAEDQIAGLEAGADAYLVKPFDPGVLTACVDNLLTQRRKLRERFRVGEAPPPESVPATPSPLDLRLRALVMARLLEPDFSPESLASAAGLSYHQLYRSLRDELGSTPSKYIRTVRAECAADLLRRGEGNVTEVAYAVGFESLSYFRRAFKERFDCSPSEYLATERR